MPEDAEGMENGGETTAAGAAEHEISCSNCGAPLDYLEGEAVITCEYCGTTTMLAGFDNIVTIESHYLLKPEVGRDEAIAIASEWLGKGFYRSRKLPGKVSWSSVESRVLPYWIVRAEGNTRWRGQQKRTRQVGSGDKKKTETYWEPVSGRFSESYTYPVYAREDETEFWGVRNVEPGRKCVFPDWGSFILRIGGSRKAGNVNMLEGRSAFDIDELKKHGLAGAIVNGQITQDRAERSARDRIIELHADKAEKKATRITDCDTTVEVDGVDLVYLPIWELVYNYGGKEYHVLVDASRKRVLSGEAPVSKWAKMTIFDIVFLLIAAICAAVASGSDSSLPWILAGVFGGSAVAYSAWTFSRSD